MKREAKNARDLKSAPAGAEHPVEVLVEGPHRLSGPAVSPVRPSQGATDPLREAKADDQWPLASCHHPAMQTCCGSGF